MSNQKLSSPNEIPSSPPLPSKATNSNPGVKLSIFEKYNQFFLSNKELYNQLDTTAKALLWLAPGRYGESEVYIELAYSIMGLFNLFHDIIAQGTEGTKNPSNPLLVPRKELPYVRWLCFFSHIELLSEIIAQRKLGREKKWFVILFIEIIKAWIKLQIVYQSGGRMVTTHSISSYREVLAKSQMNKTSNKSRIPISEEKWKKFKSYFQKSGDIENSFSILRLILEMIYIFRPVFYVLSIIRNGNESWKPWILSLVLEAVPVLSSLHLSTSSKEKEETNRRLALLLYYILRSPFFETSINHSPSFLKNGIKSIQSTPFIGPLFVSISEYLDYYRNHYFCTNGS